MMSVVLNASHSRFLPKLLQGVVSEHQYLIKCSDESPGCFDRLRFTKVRFPIEGRQHPLDLWINKGSLSRRFHISRPQMAHHSREGTLQNFINSRAIQILANGTPESPHYYVAQLLEKRDAWRLGCLMKSSNLYPIENSPAYVACLNNDLDSLLYLEELIQQNPNSYPPIDYSALINCGNLWTDEDSQIFEHVFQSMPRHYIKKNESKGAIRALKLAARSGFQDKQVTVRDPHMTDAQFSDLLKAAAPCKPSSLCLQMGPYSGKAVQKLEELLPLFSELEDFDLDFMHPYSSISTEEAKAMLRGLSACPKVKALTFYFNRFESPAIKELATTISNFPDFQSLRIYKGLHWKDGPEALESLADALASRSNLHHVSLPTLSLSDEMAKNFAEIIRSNEELRTFEIGSKKFGDQAAEVFGEAIMEHPSIESVRITMGNTSDATAQQFAEVISSRDSLKSFTLSTEKLSVEAVKILHAAFSKNPRLSLYLSSWHMSSDIEKFVDWEYAKHRRQLPKAHLSTERHGLISGALCKDRVVMQHQ